MYMLPVPHPSVLPKAQYLLFCKGKQHLITIIFFYYYSEFNKALHLLIQTVKTVTIRDTF